MPPVRQAAGITGLARKVQRKMPMNMSNEAAIKTKKRSGGKLIP